MIRLWIIESIWGLGSLWQPANIHPFLSKQEAMQKAADMSSESVDFRYRAVPYVREEIQ